MTAAGLAAHRERLSRAGARVLALAEEWADDPQPITRAEASALLYAALDTHGWEQQDPARQHLHVVPTAEEPR